MNSPVTAVFVSLVTLVLATAVFASAATNPKRGLVVWLCVAGLVPYWVGPSVGAFVPAISLITVLLFVAILRRQRLTWSRIDVGVLGLGAVCAFAAAMGAAEASGVGVILIQWIASFFLGRHLGYIDKTFASRAIAVFGIVLASFALVEYVANWHPLAQIVMDNRPYKIWSPIQYRGGAARSEWAAGHSIALGCMLAMTIPFTFTARWRGVTTGLASLVIFAGIAVTFSRSALVAAMLAVVLSVVFLGRERGLSQKVAIITAVALAGASATAALGDVYTTAGSELSASTAIRFRMLDLIETLKPVGAAGNAVETVDGRVGFASGTSVYRTLDNAYLYFGLQFGWIAAALFIVVSAALMWLLFKRTGSAAVVTIATQIPVLFSVAMITQFASLFWVVAGMAVTHAGMSRAARDADATTALADPVASGALIS